MNMGMVLFPAPLAFATGVNLEASTAWELAEDSFLVDTSHSICSFQLRMSGSVPASLQFDSAFIEDVSLKDRMTNGGFENSDSRVLLWDPFAAGGDTVTASLSNDAHEGTNALLLERTTAGGDAGINKDSHRLPWKGDNQMEVSFYAKDKPTLATGEYLLVMVCCWDSTHAIVGCEAYPLSAGSGAYTMNGHVYSPPATTAKVTVGFRIVDASGAAMSGDVLIDDVVVGDLDEGFEPRLEPTAITDWAQY